MGTETPNVTYKNRLPLRSTRLIPALLSFLTFAISPFLYGAGPEFVDIVQIIESQPVQNAQWVYWDTIGARILGVQTAPGRPGLQSFNDDLNKKLAFEVKPAKTGIKNPAANFATDGTPLFFVENDPFGGSGRAGYVAVEVIDPLTQKKEIRWLNIKGFGQTGAGHTRGTIAPPQTTYSSHRDGSATLEEGFKEATMAMVADTETKSGASRIIGIFYTGRTLKYPDGREVPLAEIVRAPLRRFDQGGGHKSQIADALAHMNVSRLMKGDFVNDANMGAYGEIVDFGCFTHTGGFAPLDSSQEEKLLAEGYRYIDKNLFTRKLGENLFLTLGIPQVHLKAIGLSKKENAERFYALGDEFRNIVFADGPPTRLDFAHVPREKLVGRLKLHEFFRDLAGNFFEHKRTRDEFIEAELARALQADPSANETTRKNLRSMLGRIHDVLEEIRVKNNIDKAFPNYGKQIRQVAHFKNREISDIVRPNLASHAGQAADRFVVDKNAPAFQHTVEELAFNSRFGTNAVADPNMIAHAHPQTTELFIPSFTDDKGTAKLFSNPDLPGAGPQEQFWFRVTTDSWKSYRDVPAKKIQTKFGEFFKVILENKDFPLTWDRVQVSPFVRANPGDAPRWLADQFNIKGPPLFFNERVGLPESFERSPSIMREIFLNPITLLEEDLDGGKIVHNPRFFKDLFEEMDDPHPHVVEDALDEFRYHQKEFNELYQKNPAFRTYIDGLRKDPKAISDVISKELKMAFGEIGRCKMMFDKFMGLLKNAFK